MNNPFFLTESINEGVTWPDVALMLVFMIAIVSINIGRWPWEKKD